MTSSLRQRSSLAGVAISADHQGWALLLVSLGLGSFVSAWFIEPLTERDALEALAPLRPRRTSDDPD